MLHTRIVGRIVGSIATFACAVSIAAWGQAGSDAQPSQQKHVLEMTRVDVFSEANWTSEEIKILGFHCGRGVEFEFAPSPSKPLSETEADLTITFCARAEARY